ncbi:MAG: hypothetical protein ACRBG0_06260 [Lewinella sp.]|jgi:hypothetical protein|uniref:hypothetical protein n=1 Tax=Lewinella sp. TaxID=2004506 RepID=UPI003D6BFE98
MYRIILFFGASVLLSSCVDDVIALPENQLLDEEFDIITILSTPYDGVGEVRVTYAINYDYTANPSINGVGVFRNGVLLLTLPLERTSFVQSGLAPNITVCYSLALTNGEEYSRRTEEVCIDT